MGGLGGVEEVGRRELGTTATGCADVAFRGGAKLVGGESTDGFGGRGGAVSRSSKLTVFAGRRERTGGFQSMLPGSDMETMATTRGMDHRKNGEETEGG